MARSKQLYPPDFLLAVALIAAIVLVTASGIALAAHHAEASIRGSRQAVPRLRPEVVKKRAVTAVQSNYGSIPMSFEANMGQAPPDVQFVAHGQGYALSLNPKEAILSLEEQSVDSTPLRKLDAKAQKKLEIRKLYRVLAHASGRHRKRNVDIRIDGANPHAQFEPLGKLPGKTNYFIGNDRTKWLSGIPNYARVRSSGIYPGVDLVYYGNQRQLEFDFIVSPGADPKTIALKFNDREHLSIGNDGTLRIGSRQDAVLLRRPSIYQVELGKRHAVQGGFVLLAGGRVEVRVGRYDKKEPLIVDPVLAYSTYLSGSSGADCDGIAVDSNGDAYVIGATPSTNFPVVNGYQTIGNANYVAFISKFDPTGTTLLYSTYLGGTGGDYGNAISLDPTGNVYVVGYTFSTDFPVVNGFQTSNNNPNYGNAFVARLDTTQSGAASLLYSSYLGGGGNSNNANLGFGDLGFGIAADASGFAYVTGITTSDTSVVPFPTTPSAYQSALASANGNAFLTVLATSQSGAASLAYSTYLGGDGAGSLTGDIGVAVAVDNFADAYIIGQTTSDASGPFPTTSNAYQLSLHSPNGNVFVTEIATTSGSQSLVYSTYFGGSTTSIIGDYGADIALDSLGNVYITGDAESSDFPVTSGAFQTTNSTNGKGFVAKFNLTQTGVQSLVYSTFLGGTNGPEGENANGISIDPNEDAFVAGDTSSNDFPTTSNAFQSSLKSSGWNAFLAELKPDGSDLLYSTYLGGSSAFGDVATGVALDSLANPYVAGYTDSSDFPTYPSNTFQTSLTGGQSGFVAKFALNTNPGITASPSPEADGFGWNNSPVTVTFSCIPGAAPIQSCPSPVTVSSEGANQVVSGTVVDTSNNTATASDTVNLDLTPPVLTISSPSNGATVSTPYVTVTGTITDSLSGPQGVNCDGAPATLSGGSGFSCTVPLNSSSNSVAVIGLDQAYNAVSTSLNVNVSMSTPSAIQVTPPNPNLLVGATQSFTAVDQTGTPRPDATWSVSNSTVASFVSGSPNTLVGNAAGKVTLPATVGTVSAHTTVRVLSGSLTLGTTLWSAPVVSGYAAQQVVQAVPTVNGPDLYSIESDQGGDVLVRAFKSDGEQLWQSVVSQPGIFGVFKGVGDNRGGLLLIGATVSNGYQVGAIADVDPLTGAQNWLATSSQIGWFDGNIAVSQNGTIYAIDERCSPTNYLLSCLDAFDATSGSLLNQTQLPLSTNTYINSGCNGYTYSTQVQGSYSDPIVGPDGAAYMEVESYQYTETWPSCVQYFDSETDTLTLLKNGVPYKTLATASAGTEPGPEVLLPPASVIPDGNGGFLASFIQLQLSGNSSTSETMIADTSGASAAISTISPYGNTMVLGDNGAAFVTDGNNVVSFNAATLQQNWTYTSTAGGALSFVTTTAGGGVAISDSELGIIQLDSNGNPGTPNASLQGATALELGATVPGTQNGSNLGLWATVGGNGEYSFVASLFLTAAPSPWIAPEADPTSDRSAAPVPKKISLQLGPNQTYNGEPITRDGQVLVKVAYGYARFATYTILDSSENPIKNQQMSAAETVTKVASNPANGNTVSAKGFQAVNANGEFRDALSFSFPTPPPPVSGQFVKSKQELAVKTKAQTYQDLRVNCADFEYNDVTVTEVTDDPNATCQ